jgi:hypothetical protein
MPRDEKLIKESLEVLERISCQFWACEGPTLKPKHMITCMRCALVAKLQKRLGVYIPKKQRGVVHAN